MAPRLVPDPDPALAVADEGLPTLRALQILLRAVAAALEAQTVGAQDAAQALDLLHERSGYVVHLLERWQAQQAP
jgi:hypothetical protein